MPEAFGTKNSNSSKNSQPPVGTMKRPATKRPAAKVGGDGEPSGEPSGTVSLTAEAVKDHNKFCEEAQSMTVEQFELALNKLDSKASMRLWKAFETSRKMSGEEEKYKEATKEGVGALRKKRKLLFGWVVDGKKTGDSFKECLEQVSLVKAQTDWGEEELRERVKGGTVIAKRDPADRRYWLFKANTQMEKTEVARHKMSGATYKAKADKQSVMDMMSAEKLELLGEEDFLMGAMSEEEGSQNGDGNLPADLAKALGEKIPKDKPRDKVPKEDKWECMSQVPHGESNQRVANRLMAFKTELTKDLASLEALLHSGKGTLPKPLVKDAEKAVQAGHDNLGKVAKALKGPGKKGAVAAVLQDALAALKGCKSKKLQLAKALKAD